MPFSCSICSEESSRICVRCTKDACDNHLCEKCRKCSDCCECEVKLSPNHVESVREALHADGPPAMAAQEAIPEPAPAPVESGEPTPEPAEVDSAAVTPAEFAPAAGSNVLP
jgi:hypothetical protein